MNETASGTNGGGSGTSGAPRKRVLWLVLGVALFIAVQSVANVESTLSDLAKVGEHESAANVWIWQISSTLVWIALIVPLWWLTARLRPPRFSWGAVAALHALATIPVSIAHVLAMVALRKLAYAATGQTYDFGDWPSELLYEYRKDVASYLMALAITVFAQWLLARPEGEAQPAVLLVPDGSVVHRVPIDAIDWATSAGNYVEIAWGQRVLLHRSTLAGLAARLGPGFAQIHRTRIVRKLAVEKVETDRNGDFTVTLASGTELRGSRRYRSAL